jgi:hypothetical protein
MSLSNGRFDTRHRYRTSSVRSTAVGGESDEILGFLSSLSSR